MNKISISDKCEEKPKFESLMDLGRYHLEKNQAPSASQFKLPSLGVASSGGFVLPKLGNSTENHFTIPKLFASKVPIDGMKNLKLQSEPSKVLIDLQSALVPETEQRKIFLKSKKVSQPNVENFIPQFVDCDLTMDVGGAKQLKVDECQERLTLKEFRLKFKSLKFKKFSMVGNIISSKYKRVIPNIRHGYEPKHIISRFTFNSPSPDDKILAHLSKKKK